VSPAFSDDSVTQLDFFRGNCQRRTFLKIFGSRQKKKDEEAAKASGAQAMKKGGMVKSSASKRADGIAIKGKTRGKMV
jgi:hypothetical protein